MMRLLRNTKRYEDKGRHGNLTWAPEIAEEMNQQNSWSLRNWSNWSPSG